MDEQYVCTIWCPFMLETVQSQAYDAIYMDSVLNPKIIYTTEKYYTLLTVSDIKSFVRRFYTILS